MWLPKPKRTRLNPEDYKKLITGIFESQGYRCAICNKTKPLQADHKIKRSQLGDDSLDNLHGVCQDCHDWLDNHGGKTQLRNRGDRMFSKDLTSEDIDVSIEGNPNACSEAEPGLLTPGSLNEGEDRIHPSASLSNPQSKQPLTIYDLPEWFDATGAQGDPYSYSKSDLEMWIVRIFNNHKFLPATASKGQKRRAFEEIWEATNGESIAIAYGFNASLGHKVYSLNYVKTCAKNMKPVAVKISKPITVDAMIKSSGRTNMLEGKRITLRDPIGESIKIKRTPAPVKEKKVAKKPTVEVPDVEWN